jgi:hypothetical protein
MRKIRKLNLKKSLASIGIFLVLVIGFGIVGGVEYFGLAILGNGVANLEALSTKGIGSFFGFNILLLGGIVGLLRIPKIKNGIQEIGKQMRLP